MYCSDAKNELFDRYLKKETHLQGYLIHLTLYNAIRTDPPRNPKSSSSPMHKLTENNSVFWTD